jgi:hypothetical protein
VYESVQQGEQAEAQPLTHGPVPGGTRFAPQVGSQESETAATASELPSGIGTAGDCEQNTRVDGWPSEQPGTFHAVSAMRNWPFGRTLAHAGAFERKKARIAFESGSALVTCRQPPQIELAPPSTGASMAT